MALDTDPSKTGEVDVRRPSGSGLLNAKPSGLSRFAPILLIAVGAIAALLLARDYLTFDTLLANYQHLAEWRDQHLILSIVVFALIYTISVAFSVPGAIWLTLIGGFLFGTVLEPWSSYCRRRWARC